MIERGKRARRGAADQVELLPAVEASESVLTKFDGGIDQQRSADRFGSAAPVRDHRMQPFGSDFFAIVGRHARTTALALANFLRGVGEGQVPR